jgi:predicted nucleic acid-binding protein
MTEYVLDTSVAMAWYFPEVFADAAIAWQSRLNARRVTMHVPTLHYWEMANALRSRVRRRTLTPAVAEAVWRLHLDAPLTITDPPTQNVLSTALEYDATAYDAVYIALVLELDIPVLTAERSTTTWVTKLGKRAISIAVLPS